ISRPFEETRRVSFEFDQIELAVPGEIHELLAALGERRQRRLAPHELDGAESRQRKPCPIDCLLVYRTQVGLVVPTSALLGENARDSFAIQIHPAIVAAVQPYGQILQALLVYVSYRFIYFGLAVFKLQGRQRF